MSDQRLLWSDIIELIIDKTQKNACTVQYSAVQCSAVQCSAVQCSAVQCSAVQCSAHWIVITSVAYEIWIYLYIQNDIAIHLINIPQRSNDHKQLVYGNTTANYYENNLRSKFTAMCGQIVFTQFWETFEKCKFMIQGTLTPFFEVCWIVNRPLIAPTFPASSAWLVSLKNIASRNEQQIDRILSGLCRRWICSAMVFL
jgi:hypothetical protein